MKKLWLGLIVVVLALVLLVVLRTGSETYEPTSPSTETVTSPSTDTLPVNDNPGSIPVPELVVEEGALTAQVVAAHSTKSDCWVVFEGTVYDLTSWIPKHPGGEAKIANTCGSTTKFEEDFLRKHKRSKVDMLMTVGTVLGDFDVVGTLG